ncbi:MAG: sigma-54-dependent transcriptional regulator [Desulfatibacillaceae bacterium]
MGSNIKPAILVVDDDETFCEAVMHHLFHCFAEENAQVLTAGTGAGALGVCAKRRIDVVILDQKLPDGDGLDFCQRILEHNALAKIIFTTAYPNFKNVMSAIRLGAHDYLSKPVDMEELALATKRALHTVMLERVQQVHRYDRQKECEDLVLTGCENGLFEVRRLMDFAAMNDSTVLITGEQGTGRTTVGSIIHYQSRFRNEAFVRLDLAALPRNLMGAELFGYEKDAFPGAVSASKGALESAEGGTLLLDGADHLPDGIQTALIHVLDDGHFQRLGGHGRRAMSARIIATAADAGAGSPDRPGLRASLAARLGAMRISLPPLRERPGDIADLAACFARNMAPDRSPRLSEEELRRLAAYDWPGNVTELKNVVERAVILRDGDTLTPSRLLASGPASPGPAAGPVGGELFGDDIVPLEEMERRYITHVLDKLDNNYSRTAQALGISRSTLLRKTTAYGLRRRSPTKIS